MCFRTLQSYKNFIDKMTYFSIHIEQNDKTREKREYTINKNTNVHRAKIILAKVMIK